MAKLGLVRIDSRLIHGQVMTMWSKTNGVNYILAVDDASANDPVMTSVYKMAVPSTLGVAIMTVKDAAEKFKNNTLKDRTYLVLIKDVETAHRLYSEGFKFDELQIGNLVNTKGTKMLHNNSRMSEEHLPLLVDLKNNGVRVYTQSVPTEKPVGLDKYLY